MPLGANPAIAQQDLYRREAHHSIVDRPLRRGQPSSCVSRRSRRLPASFRRCASSPAAHHHPWYRQKHRIRS